MHMLYSHKWVCSGMEGSYIENYQKIVDHEKLYKFVIAFEFLVFEIQISIRPRMKKRLKQKL
jgi:hypothetical protein